MAPKLDSRFRGNDSMYSRQQCFIDSRTTEINGAFAAHAANLAILVKM
jgi:hypothetical protein